jgi:arabinogalactan oligomer / maltooligosaccharide transport system substrate-binding protein
MKKHIWLGFLLLALLVAPLAGIARAQGKTNLVLWHAKQDQEGDGLLALIDAFQAANPDITVEQVYNPSGTIQDSFVAAAGSGQGPDMIIWANDSTGPWATAGLLSDLTDKVDDTLRAQASDAAWGTFTFNDKIYGIPFSAKTLAFFYNKSLVPDAPKTWADVLKTAKQVTADDSSITGLAFQNGFFHSAGFLYSLGGSLMDADGNATFGPDGAGRDAMIAYLQLHQDMYNLSLDPSSGVIVAGDSPNPGFQGGTVAMVYDGVWNLAQFESDLGDDLGVSTMPTLDNGKVPALFAQSEGFYANATVANDPAKMDAFLKWGAFVTSEEGQTIASQKAGLLPVNPAVKVDDPNLQVFAEQFALGTPFPNRAELGAFWGPMGDAITAVSAGGETPADATQAAYDLIQAAIDQIHNPTATTAP